MSGRMRVILHSNGVQIHDEAIESALSALLEFKTREKRTQDLVYRGFKVTNITDDGIYIEVPTEWPRDTLLVHATEFAMLFGK